MTISLDKGNSISLTKVAEDAGNALTKVTVGLGWKANAHSPVTQVKSRLFGRSRTVSAATSLHEYDLDASAFVVGRNGRLLGGNWLVYYSHKVSPGNVITHSGDNLVGGSGAKDDEQIVIYLDKMPAEAERIVIIVNIYSARSRNQCFGDVEKAYMRIIDDRGSEMVRYGLNEQFGEETAVTFGELVRDGNDWRFATIGEGSMAGSIDEMVRPYR
jgi:tellurium resistance protein TerD